MSLCRLRPAYIWASVTERPIALPRLKAHGARHVANLSEQIRDCLERAEECARKADTIIDPGLRDDFLHLAERWRSLARSMEFAERLGITKTAPSRISI